MRWRVEVKQPRGWHLVWTCFSEESAERLAEEVRRQTLKLVRIVVEEDK